MTIYRANLPNLNTADSKGSGVQVPVDWLRLAIGTSFSALSLFMQFLLLSARHDQTPMFGWAVWFFLVFASVCYLSRILFRPLAQKTEAAMAGIILVGGIGYVWLGLSDVVLLREISLLAQVAMLFFILASCIIGKFFVQTGLAILTVCLNPLGRDTYKYALKGIAICAVIALVLQVSVSLIGAVYPEAGFFRGY